MANHTEEKITFQSDGLQLQGRLHRAGVNGVVVTHPHPLYGGDMNNPVVETITQAYQHKGYTTLRFDFRGVGDSQGMYDEGIGEKRDVCQAMAYLAQINIENICLAGYSFGAWINAQIHPADAHRLGIEEGAVVEVSTRRGKVEITSRVDGRAQPGTLFIPFHFSESPLKRLIIQDFDPETGMPEYKVCAAAVRRLP